ncbi:MAG TPA: crosslink repair DNA glycosylase YcaQ family protein [Gaiellaceae bacterium]|nr:crosslink repair DNA glycosylase YcaQ family protein [Gaiellaceae bacterium]
MPLKVTRRQILAFRRRTGELDQRLPAGKRSLRRAAWAGMQDSMPRAALLSIHARVEGATHASWDDPSLVQVWGPRYQVYVVAASDLPLFTYARLPDAGKTRAVAEATADKLAAILAGGRMRDRDIHAALRTGNSIRYATLTGRVAIRWEGARAPHVWIVPPPKTTVQKARAELARRYLHIYGPSNAAAFSKWAGIGLKEATQTFADLIGELIAVNDAHLLAADEEALRGEPAPAAAARFLPSGDSYWLHTTAHERALLVPNEKRNELWTPRVWPGALLVDGEIVGTWRRAKRVLTIDTWKKLSAAARDAVIAEADTLPLPDPGEGMAVHWN